MQNLRLIAVFLGMTLVSAAVSPLLFWAPKVLGCRINSDPSTFLAYCNSNDFGDFEHGAFWWNLEPAAIKSLQGAEILFLGDSRVQFAFSTGATRSYFRSRHEPYYLAGFTYFENMVFAQRLMDRYKLRPRVLVINSDQTFFQDMLLATPAAMFRPKTEKLFWKTFYGYLLKSAFTHVARPICATASFLCAQDLQTLWRRRETGEWMWQGTFANPNKFNPINADTQPPAPSDADMTQIEKAANTFLASTDVPRKCIIITAVPNSVSLDEPVARRVGKRFDLPVVIPVVDDLGTIDGSHLNAVSAERWSEAFLRDAAPAIEGCLKRS
jgi:hypothetical protein